MAKTQSITSIPLSPAQERRARMLKYSVSMAVRMVCIVAMLFVSGWWLLLCALGAIFLPYFAVIVANQATTNTRRSAAATVVSSAIVPRIQVRASDWESAEPTRDDS
ncbi:MAG: DUF3099 domain-containing protein [Agromyces sp.]